MGCRVPRDVGGEIPSARFLRAFVSYTTGLGLHLGANRE